MKEKNKNNNKPNSKHYVWQIGHCFDYYLVKHGLGSIMLQSFFVARGGRSHNFECLQSITIIKSSLA